MREVTTLGRVKFRGDCRSVVLRLDDRRRHLYIVGKTGMGKTTLLQNQIAAVAAGVASGEGGAGSARCSVGPPGGEGEAVRTAGLKSRVASLEAQLRLV